MAQPISCNGGRPMEWKNDTRERRGQAVAIEFRAVTFANGERPQPRRCHANVKRWVAEGSHRQRVRGWLIISGYIYLRHSVVQGGGSIYDITPQDTLDGTPSNLTQQPSRLFLPYKGSHAAFCSLENIWV